MLAGFETPSEGSIFIDDQDMTATPPNERPVNMVFQSYAVFPHMSVDDNVGFGLEVDRVRRRRARRVAEVLELVELTSGGPQAASALRRPAAAGGAGAGSGQTPALLLLDEPLAALDGKLREHTQFESPSCRKRSGSRSCSSRTTRRKRWPWPVAG